MHSQVENKNDTPLSSQTRKVTGRMGLQPFVSIHRCIIHATCEHSFKNIWWLVRVTIVVDWLFLPQNFGPRGGNLRRPFVAL